MTCGGGSSCPTGGQICVHDAYSSIGVTLGTAAPRAAQPAVRYLDRTGSLARFELRRHRAADRLRILAELPWWLRNVGIKVLLRLRLTRWPGWSATMTGPTRTEPGRLSARRRPSSDPPRR